MILAIWYKTEAPGYRVGTRATNAAQSPSGTASVETR